MTCYREIVSIIIKILLLEMNEKSIGKLMPQLIREILLVKMYWNVYRFNSINLKTISNPKFPPILLNLLLSITVIQCKSHVIIGRSYSRALK